MYTKCRTKWPAKHEISDIFFNIRARIIILVSTCMFWGSRNSISMFKLTKRHTGYTKWHTRWRTKQRPRHWMSEKCTFWWQNSRFIVRNLDFEIIRSSNIKNTKAMNSPFCIYKQESDVNPKEPSPGRDRQPRLENIIGTEIH